MINLKVKGLPNCIYDADGDPWFINTDFRLWLDFPERIRNAIDGDETGYDELFVDYIPYMTQDIINKLSAFYYEKPEIPRESGGKGEEVLDYNLDADYIYAAFRQSYGIDLTQEDLHWHCFLALLSAIPEETMLAKIIKYRSYDGNSKDAGYKDYMRLKYMWSLPVKHTKEEQEAIDEFNELFG